MSETYNVKSVGLSKKYIKYRKKRILYLRDKLKMPWYKIARTFHLGYYSAQRIYQEAKSEQEKKDGQC